MKKRKNKIFLLSMFCLLLGILICSGKTEAASTKKICKAYQRFLAKNEQTCKYFRVVKIKGSDVPVLLTSEEAYDRMSGFGFYMMVEVYKYKNGKIKKVGNVDSIKEMTYYQGSLYSLAVKSFYRTWIQNDELVTWVKATEYNSIDLGFYESTVSMNLGGNDYSETVTENQNLIYKSRYQSSKQIKPYENTKENRKKYVSKILGKNYKEKSELVLDEKEMMIGETSILLMENKIKGAEYQWSSKDEAVATVTQDGRVTAVGDGKTEIICSVTKGGKSYQLSCKLYVIGYSGEAKTGYYVIETENDVYGEWGTELIFTRTDKTTKRSINITSGISSKGFAKDKFILYGNYIYFIKEEDGTRYLARVDINGEREVILCSAEALFGAYQDKIYYGYDNMFSDEDHTGTMLRYITLDGKNYKAFENVYKEENKRKGQQIVVNRNYLYDIEEDGSLSRINLETEEKEVLAEQTVTDFQIVDNVLYYSQTIEKNGKTESVLCKIDLLTEIKTELYKNNDNSIILAMVTNGWIYYYINENKEPAIYQINLDGTKNSRIIEVQESYFVLNVAVFENYLIFSAFYCDENGYYAQETNVNVYKYDGSSWKKEKSYYEREAGPWFEYADGRVYYDNDNWEMGEIGCIAID